MAAKRARIIAIANEKGGVGKTATVVNMGAALTLEEKKVLIVDMDPQFNATSGLGITPAEDTLSTYDILMQTDSITTEDVIVETEFEDLHLIPAHVDLAGCEIKLVEEQGRENRLKQGLKSILSSYDFIIIDTPPSLSLLTVNVFACADEILVPCQTQPYAYNALEELFDTIEAVQDEINPKLKVSGILATFYDKRTRVSINTFEKLEKHDVYGKLLFDTKIRVNTKIAESSEVGRPIVFYMRSSFGAIDYNSLAEEIVA